MYIVYFDDTCPFCQRWAARIQARDKRRRFGFAPLRSEKARQHGIEEEEQLVFYDHGKLYKGGQGVLRILWRLGGWYWIPGLLCFLPAKLFQPFYRLIARNRHRL